jgi:hypothetical protein
MLLVFGRKLLLKVVENLRFALLEALELRLDTGLDV